ncbi:MAG TPA: hydrogenase nickel incorporation protein HypB [Gemmatimonadales bacterium]|nr:hydrogenase nickel incorporation protein HypB [Gemmatimonadales bacterium]
MAVRTIEVRERVMARNDALAAQVRARLRAARVPALNLVSSPGAGKTLLLERTLQDLGPELDLAVITGDVQTQNDADRLARHTDRVVQAVVTHGACHLDASQILAALDSIDLASIDLLFIENVGNLVCPANWDLGENAKVVLFSVTEGEDKPVKYPTMFQRASTLVLTKLDLLPHVPFQLERAVAFARQVNPALEVLTTSALTPGGLEPWYRFVRDRTRARMPS